MVKVILSFTIFLKKKYKGNELERKYLFQVRRGFGVISVSYSERTKHCKGSVNLFSSATITGNYRQLPILRYVSLEKRPKYQIKLSLQFLIQNKCTSSKIYRVSPVAQW